MATLAADHLASAAGGYVPQLTNNFFLYLNGVAGAENIRLATEAAFLPKESNTVLKLGFGNEEVKFAGSAHWDAGSLTIRDMIDKDMYGILIAWRRSVYDPTTGNVGVPAAYKKTARLVLTAPDNSIVRQFQLTGLWPSDLTPGNLSYNNSTHLTIAVTCQYDKALAA
jgi:hypothetical protein